MALKQWQLFLGVSLAGLAAIPAAAQQATPRPDSASTQAPADGEAPAPQASTAGAPDPADVVVTARRREETLLDVPIAVTAFSGAQLQRSGFLDVTDLQNVTPNTTLKAARGTNSTLAAFIRGVGQQDPVPGFESGVGIYLDDVYLNRPQAAVLDIYDVERIEVLRGPQGTLYGRNTIGGAVKYVTRKLPDEPETRVRASYGSYDQADAVVSASFPVGDMLRLGVAGARLSRGGFGRNVNLGTENYNKDLWAFRGTAEFTSPDGRLFARLTGDYTDDRSNARNGHRLIPGLISRAPVLDDVFDTRAGLTFPRQNVQAGGGSLSVTAELTDALTLRSISAYRKDRSFSPIDFDALPAVDVDVPAVYRNEQTSQEFQALYKSDRLNGLLGYYYLGAEASTAFGVLLSTTVPGLSAYTAGDVRTETHSVYGDFTYDFTDALSLSLGGRYTWDQRQSFVFRQNQIGIPADFGGRPVPFLGAAPQTNFRGTADFKRFTPRVSLNWKATPDHLLYASYSEGFKGGSFDPRGVGAAAPISNPAVGRTYQDIYNFLLFRPESVNSYEVGWKGAVLDRRLTFSLAGFWADYNDVQIPGSIGATVNGVQTFIGITTNAAKARIRGLELEANAALLRDFAGVGSRVTLAGTMGYIDTDYRRFIAANGNFTGAPAIDISNQAVFQNTPRWTASGTLATALPGAGGRFDAATTVAYRSLTHQFNTRSPFLDQPGYALLDANLTYSFGERDRFSIGVYGRNLTNKLYKIGGYQFLYSDAAGNFTSATGAALPPGQYVSSLGREGVVTAFYGNPRQVFGTFTARF